VPSLQETDPTLGSGAPLLAIAEPSFLLVLLALDALGGAVGDRDAFDPTGVGGGFVVSREESGIGRNQAGWVSELLLMDIERSNQQIRVAGTLVVDLIVRDAALRLPGS